MILDVSHKTLYRYSASVVHSQHLIHMSPRLTAGQTIRHHSLLIEPAPAARITGEDAFGNPVVTIEIEVPHKELVLHARSTIETSKATEIDFATTTAWDKFDHIPTIDVLRDDLGVLQYRCVSRLTTPSLEIADYAAQSFTPGRPVLEGALDLTRRIYDDFTFDATATDISTPITEVFKARRGVCQDFAHLSLACLRAMRIPSRYVSGYILTFPPPGQTKLQGTDASHAWISVWSPETGFVGFDPTNGIVASDEHVVIAHGRDYDDVSPISGVLIGGGEHTVSVGVDVTPVP